MIRLLLDEHISPWLVGRFAEIGVYAQAVPHTGLAGRADRHIWKYALDHDLTVVTTNARDFLPLLDVDVHPGLLVLRESGLTRAEQWDRLRPVMEYLKDSIDQDPLFNKVIEVTGIRQFVVRDIPKH